MFLCVVKSDFDLTREGTPLCVMILKSDKMIYLISLFEFVMSVNEESSKD